MFADDSKLFRIIINCSDSAYVYDDMDMLHRWSSQNSLQLNIQESFYTTFLQTQKVFNIYTIHNENF